MATFRKIRDGIAPDLRRKALATKDRKPHLNAMGRAVVSLGKRAFTDPSLRARAWAPRKDDLPHNLLQKSTMLRKSIRITRTTNSVVTVGSDREYAAIHQLGGKAGRNKASKIPARPYLPFLRRKLTPRGSLAVNRALSASLRVHGL
jgi:phage virion morphogenesis protein